MKRQIKRLPLENTANLPSTYNAAVSPILSFPPCGSSRENNLNIFNFISGSVTEQNGRHFTHRPVRVNCLSFVK